MFMDAPKDLSFDGLVALAADRKKWKEGVPRLTQRFPEKHIKFFEKDYDSINHSNSHYSHLTSAFLVPPPQNVSIPHQQLQTKELMEMLEEQFGPMPAEQSPAPSPHTTTTPTTTAMHHQPPPSPLKPPPPPLLINTPISSLLPYVSSTHRTAPMATTTVPTPNTTTQAIPPLTATPITLRAKLHRQWRQRFKRKHQQQIPQPPPSTEAPMQTTPTTTSPPDTSSTPSMQPISETNDSDESQSLWAAPAFIPSMCMSPQQTLSPLSSTTESTPVQPNRNHSCECRWQTPKTSPPLVQGHHQRSHYCYSLPSPP